MAMIPLRVYLQGFMSYREPVELNFRQAPLWMLSGPNGSGKSAIFDAITYALYGVHRGGSYGAKHLINQQVDRLVVEFDFAVGPHEYRVKRTLARRGSAKPQAFYLDGPLRRSGPPGPQPIAEADMRSGF